MAQRSHVCNARVFWPKKLNRQRPSSRNRNQHKSNNKRLTTVSNSSICKPHFLKAIICHLLLVSRANDKFPRILLYMQFSIHFPSLVFVLLLLFYFFFGYCLSFSFDVFRPVHATLYLAGFLCSSSLFIFFLVFFRVGRSSHFQLFF
ncbi:hypothetical protein BJ741DRAFT_167140 [Chytriomyces cf. hyalinus JEL632]|nr:hypothetical protein BJ741DRAFT_167140 [Chytriomyces cf. hyalinus JEL632]